MAFGVLWLYYRIAAPRGFGNIIIQGALHHSAMQIHRIRGQFVVRHEWVSSDVDDGTSSRGLYKAARDW